ncbi:hypothetical protein [Streptomyces sp. DH10]|uniref:hypothetical protein n=1 Tax=Streptomyces sp. DH10 TaxID=3040121 RepID=UPI0024436576|nr:hypothetical protein [Streptomyces sp. DH10]MDG9712975.1 hypothetical protein [Streptomyces sp. DH10]
MTTAGGGKRYASSPRRGHQRNAELISPYGDSYGRPTATADQVSSLYWDLHTTHRDEAERVFWGLTVRAHEGRRPPD